MDREPLVKLVWHGDETVEVIPRLLKTAERIEIALPASYNHALFRTLNPHAPEAALETIQVVDASPDVLSELAKLGGLEPLSTLVETLRDLHASVRIMSPPTIIIDTAYNHATKA